MHRSQGLKFEISDKLPLCLLTCALIFFINPALVPYVLYLIFIPYRIIKAI